MSCNCGNGTCGGCQPKIPQSQAGAAGKNAYTVLAASFTQPAVSANVTITVSTAGQFTNAWAVPGQNVFIQAGGEYQVVATVGVNQITVTNLGLAGSAIPGATVASGGKVSPSGKQGASIPGTPGANGIARIYSNTSTISSALVGTGTLSLVAPVAPNIINADGKGVLATMYWTNNGTVFLRTGMGITFDGQNTIVGNILLGAGISSLFTRTGGFSGQYTLQITRTSSTTATAYTTINSIESNFFLSEKVLLTSIDWTVPNNFEIKFNQGAANSAICNGFFVDLIDI